MLHKFIVIKHKRSHSFLCDRVLSDSHFIPKQDLREYMTTRMLYRFFGSGASTVEKSVKQNKTV